jgi:glycosyltransferase involved in cell wall biosynthesis
VRVLLVGTGVYPIPPTGYGGVERTISELSRALAQAGAEVTVLNRVRRQRSTDEYRFALELPKLLRRERFDVLHAGTPVVANRLAWEHRPYVYTTHSRHWFVRRGLRQRWGFALERRGVRRAVATIALTDVVEARIRAELGSRRPSRLSVIPIGVDTERFRPDWARRTGRKALGVGVLQRFKRWELAARALRGLGVELALVGPCPDPTYVEELKREGEHVQVLGELSEGELVERYATSDLLFHPSSVELLAGVVLQGLAAGLPVLGAEPVRPLVEAGVTGYTAPSAATAEEVVAVLRERALELLGDEGRRRQMGEAARRSAEQRFSWPVVAAAHLELYRSVLSAPVPGG